MTIAAGFLASDGIVVCADTLYSGDALNSQGSKIMSFDCEFGSAVFTFSASWIDFAQSAIQKCWKAVASTVTGSRLTHYDMSEIIRRTLDAEYRKQVFRNPDRAARSYQLLVGLWSRVDGLGLYISCETDLHQSVSGIEFTGGGAGLARYLAANLHPNIKPVSGVLAVAAHVMAQVKANITGCGGNTHTVVLRPDGTVENHPWFDTIYKEDAAREYVRQSDWLLGEVLSRPDDELEEFVSHFLAQVKDLRRKMGIDSEGVAWRLANFERIKQYVEGAQAAARQAQRDPESTKAD
jgi:hypothetical protein